MDESQNDAYITQVQGIENQKNLCINTYGNGSLVNTTRPIYNETIGWICPAFWDNILCWPNTPANTLVPAACPTFVAGMDRAGNATKLCTESGEWYINEEINKYWTNYSECFGSDLVTVIMGLPAMNSSLPITYFSTIKTISRVGYGVSLCTLIVAFTIMFCIKRLHCARNKLHMHLFTSFILRAFISLLKDLIFVEGIGLSSDVTSRDGLSYFYEDHESNNWTCKLVISLWEFFIVANYSWILMEGLYLHNLIFRALFTDSSNNITLYIVLGWGLPVLVIIPWVITRIELEDTLCWTTHDNKLMFLIIRIPIMISNLINLVLFIKIAVVLYSKLRSSLNEDVERYQKWARSTLVLVPLFGIHYAIFVGMSYSMDVNQVAELIWLVCDQLFASFQGCCVAVLYCFLNGEVRTELKPHIIAFFAFFKGRMPCCKCCCPCQDEFFESVRSRSSVCTMISSTGVSNSNFNHSRHSKSRWDFLLKKHSQDRNRDHICHPRGRSWQDISSRMNPKWHSHYDPNVCVKCTQPYNFSSNGSIQITEATACIGPRQERCKSEPHLGLEMIMMIPRNH